MKICRACTIKYEDEKKFCRQCGGALVKDVVSSPEVMVKREGFEKKINDEPLNVEHILAYGEYLASVTLYKEALIQFLKGQQLDPSHVAVLRGLASTYQALQQHEEASGYLAKISALAPNDIDLLVQRLNVLRQFTDRDAELVAVCKSLHALRPYVYPICSLVLGIAQHVAIPSGSQDGLLEAEKLLAHAFSNSTAFNNREETCGMLHWCSVRLQLGHDATPVAKDLKELDRIQLTAGEEPLLADCLILLGKALLDRDMLVEAIVLFKDSIRLADTPEAHEQLAKAYEIQGDLQFKKGQIGAAYKEYTEALQHCSGKASPQEKINAIKAKQMRRNGLVAVIFGIVLALTALFYYGHGKLLIQTDIPATIAVGNFSAENKITTPFLLYRSYALKITKPGYVTIEQDVKPAFGRGVNELIFTLVPQYGTVKVASDPVGAKVLIKNQYEEKSCTTPCELSKIFSMPSEIELSLSGYEPFRSKLDVPADNTHDLGTILFKGDLKVDSTPTDAEVFINGKPSGKTPLSLKGLSAKKIALEIRKKDEGQYVTSVPIVPGKETNLGVVSLSKLAAIRVDSSPHGATVLLDGKRQEGKTPLVLSELALGKHEIILENDAQVSTTKKEFIIAAGEMADLGTIPLLGSIKVGSEPTGAMVFINGEKKGVTPFADSEVVLADWTTTIEIKKDNLSFKKVVSLKPGESKDLGIIKLHPDTGYLKYIVDPNFETIV
jgi:tetratricopeptide (TPR) repeat protein